MCNLKPYGIHAADGKNTSQIILTMCLDRYIGSRVCNACQTEACTHLVVVEESLIGLIDVAGEDLARTTRTRACTARVRKL